MPKLIKLLNDPEPVVRAQSAAALAAIGDDAKEALPTLLDNLLDSDVQVQMQSFAATIAVGQADNRALLDGLKGANAKGRWATPFVLANGLSGKAAVPRLLKDLEGKDIGKRVSAALSLGRIGVDAEPAIPALTRMAKEENKQVRGAAQQALAEMDKKNREAYLEKLRRERADWLQEAKLDIAKFAALNAKNVRQGQKDMLRSQLQKVNPLALNQFDQILAAKPLGAKEAKLSVALQNGPQQAYIRQLVQMHIVCSTTKDATLEADWVRDQLGEMGTEAVPAFVEGFNLTQQYNAGFV